MLDQVNILINLAASDNKVNEHESRILEIIARVNGVSKETFNELLAHPKPIGNLNTYSEDQKFEILYMMIQLMKSDGQVFKSEITFCERIAERLGYHPGVIAELSTGIFSNPSITSDRKTLFETANGYLR